MPVRSRFRSGPFWRLLCPLPGQMNIDANNFELPLDNESDSQYQPLH